MLFSIASCTEYVAPVGPSNSNNSQGGGTTDDGDNSSDSTDDQNTVYKVTVRKDGLLYTEGAGTMMVRWSNGKSAVTLPLGIDGTVSTNELDGNYSVSLINIPDGYTYDPNINNVTDSSPEITIDLLKIKLIGKFDKEKYGNKTESERRYTAGGCIKITSLGVYRAVIEEPTDIVYFEYEPQQAGKYSIESMLDISAEMYNPIVDVYLGTTAAKYFRYPLDGGGVSGSYTTNFKHDGIELTEDQVGSCFTFGIRVDGRDAEYPMYVDFVVKYVSGVEEDDTQLSFVYPEFINNGIKDYTGESFQKYDTVTASVVFNEEAYNKWFTESYKKYIDDNRAIYGKKFYNQVGTTSGGITVLDSSLVKLNPDDGFYHLYDEEKYADYDGWGPLLFVSINKGLDLFNGASFSNMEYYGNKVLTVCNGLYNYKLFIEGYTPLTSIQDGTGGTYSYFCSCNDIENCDIASQHLPEDHKYQPGYQDLANGLGCSGRVPVTEELKLFLERYVQSQKLFADGYGLAETAGGFNSDEESAWLFACGYYSNTSE